jgi:hypothetical protein
MKYLDGQVVKLGDTVALEKDEHGVVVCSIDTGEYSEAYPPAQWSYLESGVLIKFPSYGLVHYKEPDPDLRLVARASVQAQR